MKRILLGIIAWLLTASISFATPVATNMGTASGTAVTLTITLGSSVPAGSTIVLAGMEVFTGSNCGSAAQPSDTAGNTYTIMKIVNPNASPANGQLCIFTATNITALSSGNTIVWTSASGGSIKMLTNAVSVTGVTTSPIDVFDGNGSGSSFCTLSSFTITPTVSGDLLVAFCGLATSTAPTDTFTQDTGLAWAIPPVSNFTTTISGFLLGGGNVVYNSTSPVDYNASFATPGSGFVADFIIALKSSGAGSASITRRSLTGVGN